jgi:hypothetical protein
MNCLDALDTLEAVAVGALPDTDEAAREAERHCSTCAACQTAWPQRLQWSQQLTTTMQAVPVPAGLQERLQTACATPVSPATALPARTRRRWLLTVASVCTLLLAAGLGWWFQPLPQLSDSELLAAMHVDLAPLPVFTGRFEPELPDVWRRYYALDRQLVRGFPEPGHPAAGQVALVPFQFQTAGRELPVRGRLLMLRRDQYAGSVSAMGFAATSVIYMPTGEAYALWTEGNLVFVCLVPSGPADLARFKDLLTQPRPLT